MTNCRRKREEAASALTHGVGALAGAIGGAALVALAIRGGDGWRIAGAAVYSLSLVLLYAASTLYHTAWDRPARGRLQLLDHCAIFVFIAGTYTPFTLISLQGAWGWGLLGGVWGLTAAGVTLKLCSGRFRQASVPLYVAMGWLVIVAIDPLLQALPALTLLLLVAGGISYTAGTFFYLNGRLPYNHAIWHMFVLGGSTCHFAAVTTQVIAR